MTKRIKKRNTYIISQMEKVKKSKLKIETPSFFAIKVEKL